MLSVLVFEIMNHTSNVLTIPQLFYVAFLPSHQLSRRCHPRITRSDFEGYHKAITGAVNTNLQ